MSLETDVQNLTAATTNLLNAVNISKATLDSKVTDATTQATNSANSATASANSATASAASAASALNIYGNTAAMNTAVTSASTSASNAATSATNAANSATQAAASAASASQIVLGVASGLPNVLPSLNLDFANSKIVDPRITFSRASAATFYDGKTTAKAEENLLQNSNAFSNGTYWGAYQTVATANAATAPDGTATASKLSEVASTIGHYLNLGYGLPFVAGQVITFSIHVKKGDGATAPDYVQLFAAQASTTNSVANFNISTGTVANTTNCTAAVASLGSGWYRLSITYTVSGSFSSNNVGLAMTNNNATAGYVPVYAGSVSTDIYLWGAQLEQRSSTTAYTPTTTQPITNYIPVLQTAAAGVPRIDHDPVTGECKGLLIEEQRTNLVVRSEEFSTASWSKAGASVEANVIVAPDGTLTGDLLTSSNAAGYVYPSSSLLAAAGGGTFTYSVYAKAGNVSSFALLVSSGSYQGNFDLSSGTASTASANTTVSITPVGNGWYRCSMTCASVQNAAYSELQIGRIASGKTLYLWGAQFEAGAFPTSYIKTETSQVTRSADSAGMTGTNFSSWYRADEGSFSAEVSWLAGSEANAFQRYALALSDLNTTNERIALYNYNGAGGWYMAVGDVGQANVSGVANTALPVRSAFAYATNNSAGSVNGSAPVTDTSCKVPNTISRLSIGGIVPAGNAINGHIKKLAYYPKRLSNSELQALTAA